MRIFNQLVFDQVVRGNTEIVSPPEFHETLGKADALVFEVEVEEAAGTTPNISVRYKHSNSGKGFVGFANIITTASLATLPYRDVKSQAGPLGGMGQVGITLGNSDNSARVRVWACGRSV